MGCKSRNIHIACQNTKQEDYDKWFNKESIEEYEKWKNKDKKYEVSREDLMSELEQNLKDGTPLIDYK